MHSDTLIQVDQAPIDTIIVQPRKSLWDLDLKGLWQYRELLYFLVWRDVKVKYKQTALGVAWAVLQPLLATLIFSVFLAALPGSPRTEFHTRCLCTWRWFRGSTLRMR